MTTHQLSPYEQFRLERIKRNEERLASLGLLDAKKNLRATTTRRQPPSTPTPTPGRMMIQRPKRDLSSMVVTPSPSRSSRRLNHKPVQYQPLLEDNVSLRKARRKFKEDKKMKTSTPSNNFRLNIPMDISSSPLSKEDKAKILKKVEGDSFLGKFEVSGSAMDLRMRL